MASEKLQQQREDKLIAGLKELGTGKNKIAQALAAKKIKGTPGDPDDCAVAKYVKKLFPKAKKVEVDGDSIEVYFNDGGEISVPCSKALGAFISDFDDDNPSEYAAAVTASEEWEDD